MLEEPSKRVHKNSDEYQKIMRSVHNIQKKLLKSSDNKQAAREEYVEGMEMIMHNIKMYYLHKAKDGIAADATYDKLMAVKRVEKLLQSRYKEVEKKDYEEKTKDVPNMFKYEPNRKLSGDEYVLDLVKGEIGNIRKELFDYKEENNEIKRSNSFVATDVKQTLENADKKRRKRAPRTKGPKAYPLPSLGQ